MNEGESEQFGVRLIDTGQWYLIVEVSENGMEAILKNVEADTIPCILLFRKQWTNEGENLLEEVEREVYNNPRILDDYATHIVITSSKNLWIPADFTEDEEFNEVFFTSVYPASPDDIGSDFGNEEVNLYTLVPGLNSFLKRTLPGSKITSHMTIIKSKFDEIEIEKIGDKLPDTALQNFYINIRKNFVDIFAYENGRFIFGATHPYISSTDILYKILLGAKAYGLIPSEASVCLIGKDTQLSSVNRLFRKFFKQVLNISVPKILNNENTSFAVSLIAGAEFEIEII